MRNILKIILLVSLFLLFLSCKNRNCDCPERNLRSISFGFESSLDDWLDLGGDIEVRDSSNIRLSSEKYYNGNKSVQFIISHDSYVNGGVRGEMSFDQMIEAGDETFYEYSFLIPTDYQDVSSLKAADGRNNWQILGQWHDQPDECLCEDWSSYQGNSPPIAIYYVFLDKSDSEYLKLLSNQDALSIFGMDTTWDKVAAISLEYYGKSIAIHNIEKGEWISLKFHIKWSLDDNGFIQVWKNQQPFTNGRIYGKNMLNNASHYFKFGLYRHPDIPFTNSIYYDKIEIY